MGWTVTATIDDFGFYRSTYRVLRATKLVRPEGPKGPCVRGDCCALALQCSFLGLVGSGHDWIQGTGHRATGQWDLLQGRGPSSSLCLSCPSYGVLYEVLAIPMPSSAPRLCLWPCAYPDFSLLDIPFLMRPLHLLHMHLILLSILSFPFP